MPAVCLAEQVLKLPIQQNKTFSHLKKKLKDLVSHVPNDVKDYHKIDKRMQYYFSASRSMKFQIQPTHLDQTRRSQSYSQNSRQKRLGREPIILSGGKFCDTWHSNSFSNLTMYIAF